MDYTTAAAAAAAAAAASTPEHDSGISPAQCAWGAASMHTDPSIGVHSQPDPRFVDVNDPSLAAVTGVQTEFEPDAPARPLRDDHDEDAWFLQDGASPTLAYVDLLQNPEGYTGYAGPSARRIWHAFKSENCFTDGDDSSQCLEERVFGRVVSGLQASINTHIAATRWGKHQPSTALWVDRVGKWPERLHNLYFAYVVVFRALAKAGPAIAALPAAKVPVTDLDSQQAMSRVQALLTPPSEHALLHAFDESRMFAASTAHPEEPSSCSSDAERASYADATAEIASKQALRAQFRASFRNISRIMDCVGCDKCRLWGKLQFLGVATAIRVLESGEQVDLSHNEAVALVNLAHRLAMSVAWVPYFTWCEFVSLAMRRVLLAVMCTASGWLLWVMARATCRK